MKKKMYWGITSLIIMIGVVGVYFMLQPDPDPVPEKKLIVPSETDLEQVRKAKQPPRDAKDGFTWEWHADHWHEVPIAQNDAPVAQPVKRPKSEWVEKKTYEKPLTYDEELFKTNPVKSLILEMEARGHWGVGYIPDFPPDDLEAQEFARYQYRISYMDIQDGKEMWDVVLKKETLLNQLHEKYGRFSPRIFDLHKLSWAGLDTPPSADWETLLNSPTIPSEFFKD
ncbi:hypothetical protein JT359_14730 [Candidatus Poribacteria bacterium]|nr:hypothetical protein [Candidatus Poribacteria bacterium]